MSYIYRLYNKDGYTQIDRDYRNMSFVEKISLSIPKRPASSTVGGSTTRTILNKTDVLAIKKLGNFGNVLNKHDVGFHRVTPNSQGIAQPPAVGRTVCAFINGNDLAAEPVELYRFSPNFVPSDTAGMPFKRIYNDSGVLIFDSGRFPMRTVASFNGNVPYNSGSAPELTLYAPDVTRQYAVYCCKPPLHVLGVSGVVRIGYLFFTQNIESDGRFRFDFWIKYEQLGSFSGNFDNRDANCSVSIIDVTGH